MLKGISMQLNAISTYLQSQLHAQELSWDTFLLNTEKNTSEMLKLTRIAFTELDEYLPRDVGQAFDRAAGLLRKYFKNRPKGQVEQEEQREYRMEYDEVQHFLDNKPEIVTNDEQRGELFKFLTMNEQKQKNTQILLESMPRYSLDYAYHPIHPNRNKSTIGVDTPKFTNANLPEITKSSLKNSGNSLFKPQSKLTRTDSRRFSELKDGQAQTGITFDFIESMLAQFYTFSQQNGGSIVDFTSQITNYMQEIVKKTSLKKHEKSNQANSRFSEGQQQFQSNKQKNNEAIFNEEPTAAQPNNINQTAGLDQGSIQLKNEEKTSALPSTKKITARQQSSIKVSTQKGKKNAEKRQSSNSLSSSKKDVLKGVSTKRQTNRNSKDLKEQPIKQTNQSKFSKQNKQKKSNSPSRYVRTILQTTQQMANSTSYQVTPPDQQKMRESEITNQDIVLTNSLHQQSTQTAPKNLEQNSSILKRFSKKSNGQREKILSNKQEPNHSDFLIQQAYACTATHPFYRKPSEKAESSLPKIEQRGKPCVDRAESLKKKIYQSSPYAKALLQNEQKQMKYSNSSSQLNHRSLHLNSSEYSFLSPKDTNISKYHRTQLVNEASQDYKNLSSFRFDFSSKIAQCDRQNLLREQHNRLVRQIQENVSRKAHPQWTKVIRSIRHYELMHASLCGENCVHLSKFYQFLKKKNLGNCINRKQLLLHKKNIQINTNL